MKKQVVINGDNLELLKQYPDNYFDSVVTDPPYGLGKEPNANDMLKAWLDNGYLEVTGTGFMGKEWDSFVPQPIFWKEVFRVLKHGGHVVAFYGTRTYDWGCMAMRLAGFEIRDCIQWIYGSGFPKSHNISKAIDKTNGNERKILGVNKNGKGSDSGSGTYNMNNGKSTMKKEFFVTESITEESKKWEGWGSALKPANEPIVLARKPLEKGLSIAENVMKYGTGAINIDASRIENFNNEHFRPLVKKQGNFNNDVEKEWQPENNPLGRFPANIIFTHHADCVCQFFKYEGEEEINEEWTCFEYCPIKILDEQSGVLNKQAFSKTDDKSGWQNSYVGGNEVNAVERKLYLDEGGASRFFYVAKASQWERNYGCEQIEEKLSASSEFRPNHLEKTQNGENGNPYGRWKPLKNNHPTIKPIKLMQYLVRMITPPNGIVLDPFCGSGTTGIACKIDDFEFVGLELNEEYVQIAQTRIEYFDAEKVLIDETKIYQMRTKNEDDANDYGCTQLNLFD